MAPEDVAQGRVCIFRVIAKKEAFQALTLCAVHRDGREVTIEVTGMPVFSREGIFSGFYGIARDVSRNNLLLTAYSACVPVALRPGAGR